MKDWIDNLMRRIELWELKRLAPQVEQMADAVAMLDDTARRRLDDYDREAKLLRDHYKARLQIDAIETARKLAAKQHRLSVLERSLGLKGEGASHG